MSERYKFRVTPVSNYDRKRQVFVDESNHFEFDKTFEDGEQAMAFAASVNAGSQPWQGQVVMSVAYEGRVAA